jgi:ABC-type dipeptide/oligopeptide/nickel transport system permease component
VQNIKRRISFSTPKGRRQKKSRIVGKLHHSQCYAAAITGLALGLGQFFSGALIYRDRVGYPGLGMLLYRAYHQRVTI